MQFKLLGPLEVLGYGKSIPLGGLKRRATLGYLLLNANTPVPTSRLLDALWDDHHPPTARKMLQNAISGLRVTLAKHATAEAPVELATHVAGYVLRVPEDRVDLAHFQSMVEDGRAHLAADSPHAAAAALRRALQLWRGPALADLAEAGIDWPEMAALKNSRLTTLEDYVDAEIAAGNHHEIIDELEAAAEAEPARERLCAQLMRTLYQSGRQADALSAYRRTRTALINEFGLDPGHELQRLEQAILRQDPSLNPSPPPPPTSAARTDQVVRTEPSSEPKSETAAVRTERKWVSVLLIQSDMLFADGEHDPEFVDERFRLLTSTVHEQVEQFGGTLHSSLGAVWFAAFGARRTYEDDAERAIRAGFSIRRRLQSQCAVQHDTAGTTRIAVATGEALVTSKPGETPADVTGEVLDRCMRLLYAVAPGRMGVSETTRLASLGAVRYGDDGDVVTVRAEHESATISGPFVGRERDTELLDQALRDVQQTGLPRLVTLLGEPGIGKSRLITEFRHAHASTRSVLGRTPRFGWNAPLTALADVVADYCGISPDDSARAAAAKLQRTVHELIFEPESATWVRSHLESLLGLVGRPIEPGESFEAWRRFLEELAARTPQILVFDDLQYADGALLDFVEDLDEQIGPVPLLVIASARSELLRRRPTWGSGKQNVTTHTVGPLPDDAVRELVGVLSSRHGMPPQNVAEHQDRNCPDLIDWVGGNPLFAAEHARMLSNELAPERTPVLQTLTIARAAGTDPEFVQLPHSVHSIIAARLDTLSQTHKTVLANAAVFDRVVWAEPVAAITDLDPDTVAEHLRHLEQRGFLSRTRLRSSRGRIKYEFRHNLVRDVAYAQLPRPERAAKHSRCATWLETNLENHPNLLQHHRQRAG